MIQTIKSILIVKTHKTEHTTETEDKLLHVAVFLLGILLHVDASLEAHQQEIGCLDSQVEHLTSELHTLQSQVSNLHITRLPCLVGRIAALERICKA